jgi:hypothetical protein
VGVVVGGEVDRTVLSQEGLVFDEVGIKEGLGKRSGKKISKINRKVEKNSEQGSKKFRTIEKGRKRSPFEFQILRNSEKFG